ncbi:site-2 protease family protein [Synechococcus sp. Nb3U1]|uniref:site-2 protease family protein n=1 Tax=Synechococcus sp. Nb3U1 TaxID=1914529 RepID=UPI001F331975|nr:site-2 protease family protein [Synechococcus sp. Nb3U1]MCF2971743.1 site-2 protease family protein [Synechococcus sp. Nb3U1]
MIGFVASLVEVFSLIPFFLQLMADWILLALVGSATYLLLQKSVARLSKVPWRILWLVMMMPPLVWVLGRQVFQYEMPPLVMLVLFLTSYFTSMTLVRRGRIRPPVAGPKSESEISLGSLGEASKEDRDPELTSESNPEPEDADADAPTDPIVAALAHTPISDVPREKLSNCFPWNVFYLQNVEYRPQAIICRGNLRADPSEAYERVQQNVETTFGNRFLLVLQEGFAGKPFFALVPNPAARRSLTGNGDLPILAVGLLLFTFWTTLSAGAQAAGVSSDQLLHLPSLMKGLPYALAIIAILGSHEWIRYWVARRHNIKTSLPYFIPVPFVLGTFGAFIQLKEPVPNRKVLFDIGISGPLAGSVVALTMLLLGLFFSEPQTAPAVPEGQPTPISFHQIDPRLSVLLGILSRIVLWDQLGPGQVIDLHPLAFAGWLGLVVIAFNLMPVGQLDGGHIVHAVYGQQMGANVGRVARWLVLLLALTVQPWLLLWALLLFVISSADEPALNDVTELDEVRDLLGLGALTLLVLILLPVPPFLQTWLGLA